MIFKKPLAHFLSVALASATLATLTTPYAHAWGSEGHRMINRLAASTLPADTPAFLRTPEAINEIEYLGPEPDRWRSPGEPALSNAQAPEHFIDLELADALGSLPKRRFDFEAKAYAAGKKPDVIGLLPWETDEVWERLKNAMRAYRGLAADGWAIMSVTARSRCTPPCSTTAGPALTRTAIPPRTRFIGSSKGRLSEPTFMHRRCRPR
jgi:hypothetical protein